MPTQIDPNESEWLRAFEQGQLKPIATKGELARVKAAASATAIEQCKMADRSEGATQKREPHPAEPKA